MLRPISAYNSKNLYQSQFKSEKKNKQNEFKVSPTKKPIVYTGLALLATLGVATAVISSRKKTAQAIDKFSVIKNEMSKYVNDVNYRKSILKDMNLPEADYYKLRSIIGAEELDVVIKDLSTDKEHFLPGKKTFRLDKEPVFSKENVESGKFAANLHLHTTYSDGTFTVPELMEQASKYADSRVEKLGKDNPFYLAITDHDTLEGCREAVNIVLNNPEKYKNLRLVLAVENTVLTHYPEVLNGEVETHMISYAINPFDKELRSYYEKQVQKNRKNIQTTLDNANEHFLKTLLKYKIEYNMEEFDSLAPQVKYRNMPSNYFAKDYLQFKLIYSSMVEKNEALIDATGLKPEMLDFASPQKLIGENLDYSKGQKYYEYYVEAIKKDLKSKLPTEKQVEVDKHLGSIPEEIIPILNEIEASVGDKKSELYVQNTPHPKLEVAVNYLKTKEGVLGIAHPGVVFPMKNLKTDAETLKFYDQMYADFKAFGQDKAKYAEDNYATYFENQSEEFLNNLSKKSSKYDLEKTGGLDTHISDIFASK